MNGHFHQQFQLHSYKSEQIKYKHMLKKPWSPSDLPAVLFLLVPVA